MQRGITVRSRSALLFRLRCSGLGLARSPSWLGFNLIVGGFFRESEGSEPGGVHVNSLRLNLMLGPHLRTLLCCLLLFLKLRFGPGPSLFWTAAHRHLLDASELGLANTLESVG